MKIPTHNNALKGLGDRWENSIRKTHGLNAETYVQPTPQEVDTMETAVRFVRNGLNAGNPDSLDRARELVEPVGYRLDTLRVGADSYLVLEEEKPEKGWGLVVFRENPSPTGLIVEIPHPVADAHTPELGLQAFENINANVYILAGAHRSNSKTPSPDVKGHRVTDMTHTKNTIFQAFHRGATNERDDVLQIHGFSAKKTHEKLPEFPASQQIVLSDGADDGRNPRNLVSLERALKDKGLQTDIASFEDEAGRKFGATTNVQRDDMEDRGLTATSEFVHLEADTSLRVTEQRQEAFDKIVTALGQVWPRGT